MVQSRFVIVVVLVTTSLSFAQAQGRSGRDRDVPRPGGAEARVEQRVGERTSQVVKQQLQRRAGDEARRSVERRHTAAEMAARDAARRSAREANSNADLRRFAKERGIRPELVADQALQHADLHASIAASLRSGKRPPFTEQQRGHLKEVFGDPDLLETEHENHSTRSKEARGDRESSENEGDRDRLAPGSQANPRARLANAIRVRRSQISELRDRAIETGDQKLLERADRMEKTLAIFLANQARVEANLAEVARRTRTEDGLGDDGLRDIDVDPPVSEPVERTADLEAESGLIE